MKINFNSYGKLPQLIYMLETPSMIMVVGAISLENNKYYPQGFIDECLYKIKRWRVKMNLKKVILK